MINHIGCILCCSVLTPAYQRSPGFISALCTFWIHVAIRRTWSILKKENIQISSFTQTPKITRLVKKCQEPAVLGTPLLAARWGWRQETTGIELQNLAISFSYHRLFLICRASPRPAGNNHSHSAQGTQSIHMYKTSKAQSLLSLQELPQLSWGSCCCSPALTQPQGSGLNQANATFLLPCFCITLPVESDTANW